MITFRDEFFVDSKTLIHEFESFQVEYPSQTMAANIFEKLSEMFSSLKAEDGDDEEEEEEEEVSLWVLS